MLRKLIGFFLEQRLLSALLLLALLGLSLAHAPMGWKPDFWPSAPVKVDAIPNLGENQQIVFTRWPGRSPQDVQDQITYPLTTELLGIPGVKSVRSNSMFGFSSIYVVFKEKAEFYWSRTRILEKLNALPADLLPAGVQPQLGPDATALGQVFWYTLEGRDSAGKATGGWDLHELRSIQDFQVKYALSAAEGVAEVASIGGHVKEYQVNVDPQALKHYGIGLTEVARALASTNQEIGARTLEINRVEYLVRGLGYIDSLQDLAQTPLRSKRQTPLRIGDVAQVQMGPAERRGILDKGGAEAVGGVVVARHGANPMEVIENVKKKIEQMAPGLPSRKLADGRSSRVTVVPFYDRSELIRETLGTLRQALSLQVLVTILVVIFVIGELRASLLVSGMLPLSVLMVFIPMYYLGVTANIVALSGIAIAIGTVVDLGIILSENILSRLKKAPPGESLLESVRQGSLEVSGAIVTAVSTTILSFLPVFTLEGAEGKLFGPLAATKTFALVGALLLALLVVPSGAWLLLRWRFPQRRVRPALAALAAAAGLALVGYGYAWAGYTLVALGLSKGAQLWAPPFLQQYLKYAPLAVAVLALNALFAREWLPLGPTESLWRNALFTGLLIGVVLGFFSLLRRYYGRLLHAFLGHKKAFLVVPLVLMFLGLTVWKGFAWVSQPMAWAAQNMGWQAKETAAYQGLNAAFPGLGKEFMPALDEGSFLLMPTTLAHAGVEQNKALLQKLDKLVAHIPEVEGVLGKAGRVESALDPAPLTMFENLIQYKPEYMLGPNGRKLRFRTNGRGHYLSTRGDTLSPEEAQEKGLEAGDLQRDPEGQYFRNWRPRIASADDIWELIAEKNNLLPSLTGAPKLQPIETRQIMLQTGMRAPMGIKVYGPSLEAVQSFSRALESLLKKVPAVKPEAVFAERIFSKPYVHIRPDRQALARHGLTVGAFQQQVGIAVGGKQVAQSVEGRERYGIRLRYPRELRNSPKALREVLISLPSGGTIPLRQLAEVGFSKGPKSIRSENTFLTNYVLLDKAPGYANGAVVEQARARIEQAVAQGEIAQPAGVSYEFAGDFENQQRAEKRLALVVPITLALIFLILYLQFRSVGTALMVFFGVAMAFTGGFLLLWLFGQEWFFGFSLFGTSLRDLFQMGTVHLSVAVWVGFIALFGIATDDGVLMATYLDQRFRTGQPADRQAIRQTTIAAATKRIRPAVTTTATTLIALLPVLGSTGKGSEILVPMAIPTFGGMAVAVITYFLTPVLYCWRAELQNSKQP